jgi:hypothetical protein
MAPDCWSSLMMNPLFVTAITSAEGIFTAASSSSAITSPIF